MIYLDNAATTRPSEEALRLAAPFLTDAYFNPSALYGGGFSVAKELSRFRAELLSYIADPEKFDLIFTSGGTEADNFAVFGGGRRGNVVLSAGEHAAVERSCAELKNRGLEVRLAPIRRDGSVDGEALLSLVDEKTSLVSVVHVNNETGAVNDVISLSRQVKAKNPRTLFMSDGVQAFGKIPVKLTGEIDLYTISAHKIGGLKGTGALIKRRSLALPPRIYGGGQENGLRSGTENVFGAAVFCYAARHKFSSLQADGERLARLKELLFSSLEPSLFTRISPTEGTPYILTVSAVGMRGEVLQRMLWEKGVTVGTGSACASKHPHSRVLTACGYGAPVLDGVLRLSFSPSTTEEEVIRAAALLNETAAQFGRNL